MRRSIWVQIKSIYPNMPAIFLMILWPLWRPDHQVLKHKTRLSFFHTFDFLFQLCGAHVAPWRVWSSWWPALAQFHPFMRLQWQQVYALLSLPHEPTVLWEAGRRWWLLTDSWSTLELTSIQTPVTFAAASPELTTSPFLWENFQRKCSLWFWLRMERRCKL